MARKILVSLLIAIIVIGSITPRSVSAAVYAESGFACRSGKNIYYAFTSKSKSTPIYCFNVKTGLRTKIYPRSRVSLKDFKNLNVLNGYIYCSARPLKSLKTTNIYRIKIKTGKVKLLIKGGVNPTIVGDKIVYDGTREKKVKANFGVEYVPSGKKFIAEQDGTKKKTVGYEGISQEAKCRGTKIAYGKYKFYISKDGKRIYRIGGKKKTICRAKKIVGFRVLKGYLIVKTTKRGKNYAYCVKNNGKQSTRILTW